MKYIKSSNLINGIVDLDTVASISYSSTNNKIYFYLKENNNALEWYYAGAPSLGVTDYACIQLIVKPINLSTYVPGIKIE